MAISAKEVKALAGAKTKMAGLNTLYFQLEKRQWHRFGREYTAAGYDYSKDLVHFTATWPAEGGGIGHSRVAVSMATALNNKDGDLAGAAVLH